MEREVSTGNEPYIIVSSDTHAGLQCEQYREYLDPVLHAEFDEYVAERHEHRRISEELNGEFVKQWESENEWGLKGAYDPEVRDPVLDADGVAGEIIFADGD
ncbi:MAG TPA: amidohydrolase, partial [Acidimicrobiaceae bacterium]|nr:amidohydrolase [Acidimicrobiaceae bacterium]